jgi:hypothetical protein
MHGVNVIDQDTIAMIDAHWDIAGVGDFNGDGNPDILLKNSTTGEMLVWFMKGIALKNTASISGLPPPWNVATVGDFNGDGSPDILWLNPVTGEVVVWYMDGVKRTVPDTIAARAPPLSFVEAWGFNVYAVPNTVWRHISTVSHPCPNFTGGPHTGFVISSQCIRAPPIFPIFS